MGENSLRYSYFMWRYVRDFKLYNLVSDNARHDPFIWCIQFIMSLRNEHILSFSKLVNPFIHASKHAFKNKRTIRFVITIFYYFCAFVRFNFRICVEHLLEFGLALASQATYGFRNDQRNPVRSKWIVSHMWRFCTLRPAWLSFDRNSKLYWFSIISSYHHFLCG